MTKDTLFVPGGNHLSRDAASQARILLSRVEALTAEVEDLRAEVIPQATTLRLLDRMAKKLEGYRLSLAVHVDHITDTNTYSKQRKFFFDISRYTPTLSGSEKALAC